MEGIHSLWRLFEQERTGPCARRPSAAIGTLHDVPCSTYLWGPESRHDYAEEHRIQTQRIVLRKIAIGGSAPAQLRVTIRSAFLVLRFRKRNTSKWNKIEHRMFCHITAN